MKKNVGNIDKVVRVIIGLAIILWGILDKSWWGLIGLIPLFTSISGICLLYSLFGISTKKETALKQN